MTTNVDILSLFDNGKIILFKWKNEENWPVEYVSQNILELTGYNALEFTSSKVTYASLIHKDDLEQVFKEVTENSSSDIKVEVFTHKPYRIKTKNDTYTWVQDTTKIVRNEQDEIINYIGYITDITETINALNHVKYFSTHDQLTNLPNLILFKDRVEQLIISARRDKKSFALLYIDIDNFRSINDTLGHEVGNKLLVRLSEVLIEAFREKDSICRHSGDEFFLLLEDIKNKNDILTVINKLFALNQKPFHIDGNDIFISYSVGVVMFPDNGDSFEELFKFVDNAMYDAKNRTKNSYSFFSKDQYDRMIQKQYLHSKLHNAIENDEIFLMFQPKIDLKTNQIVSAEALVRWENKEDGFIGPNIFIPIAEDSGYILKLGNYIFQQSCLMLKNILKTNPDFLMSINISTIEFEKENFVQNCIDIITAVEVNPKNIELELTESVLLESPKESTLKITELKKLGFKFAIDDFGTGYSSLSYLKDFDFDTIKIDMSFISQMLEDKNTLALVKIIVGFNQIFNVKIVAEGVETQEEWKILEEYQCDMIQGYFFSKPLKEKEFLSLLESH